jgi:TP901 family phage tail tape measure protein
LNAYANITIRVLAANGMRQMRQMRGEIAAFDASVNRSNRTSALAGNSFARAMQAGTRWGTAMQATGRQIHYNFGIPLAIAGAAAVKFALDNEKAMTRVRKVYGDGSEVFQQLAKTEIPALERAFEALSNRFGVAQKDVINIAADWAAAGASGLALAKSVKLTMETMVLGEMEAAEATTALIAIQAQYGQSTEELAKTIDTLNMVENQTGVSMQGLVQGLARAAGVARTAGVDVRHLAAMMAALVPASGTAANAGNALKTIISRLLAPTDDASKLLHKMGIGTAEVGWKSLNAAQRLELLARKFEGLDDAQKSVVSTYIASRYQISRFDVLMRDIINKNGYYQKALNATSSEVRNYQQRVRELNAVLESNPQKMKQIGVIFQNVMADIIQPLIPVLVYAGQQFAMLGQRISEMNPAILKMVGAALAFVMVFGLVTRLTGAFMLLGVTLAKFTVGLSTPFFAIGRGLVFMAAAPFGAIMSGLFGILGAVITLPVALFSTIPAIVGWAGTAALAFATFAVRSAAVMVYLAQSTAAMLTGLFPLLATIIVAGGTALSTVWTGIWFLFGAQFRAFAYAVTMLWRGFLVTMATVLAPAGAALASAWGSVLFMLRYLMLSFVEFGTIIWRGFLAALTAFTAIAGPALASAWGSMMFMLRYLTISIGGGITAAWASTLFLMRYLLLTLTGPIGQLWGSMMFMLRYLTISIGNAIAGAWNTVLFLMRYATATFAAVTGPLWAGMMAGLAAMTTAIGAAWVAAWNSVLFLMRYGTATLTTLIPVLWSTMMAALPVITFGIGGAFAAAWRALILIAQVGAATIGMAAAAGVAGIRILATSPGALAGLFAGGFRILIALATGGVRSFALIGRALAVALSGPIGWAVLGAIGLLYLFRDQIASVYRDIVGGTGGFVRGIVDWFSSLPGYFGGVTNAIIKSFNMLPLGVRNAFQAVVDIVRQAALAVYDMFSYFNPFAHHSPSLVENVTNGMAAVTGQYALMARNTGGILAKAKSDLAAYKKMAASMGGGEWNKEREEVKKAKPAALPVFDALVSDLSGLNAELARQNAVVQGQERVVARWKARLDEANASLDKQNAILDGLRDHLQDLQAQYDGHKDKLEAYATAPLIGMGKQQDAIFANDLAQKKLRLQILQTGAASKAAADAAAAAYDREKNTLDQLEAKLSDIRGEIDAHKQAMQDYASTPIKGMGAMSDAIFENQMAQKRLRLEMMKMEDAGGSIDDVRKKLGELQGDIERGQSEISDLRLAGAGSDITGPMMDNLNAMEKQRAQLEASMDQTGIAKLQKELDALAREGERLDLENSINFDPLTRQIEELANAKNELPFDEIIAGINREKAAIDQLTPSYNQAEAAVRRQEAVVKEAAATRDAANAAYDREKAKIDELEAALAKLQTQGEIMQLKYDIEFGPALHEIEKLTNTQKEMSFDTIVAGIKTEQAAMDALTPKIAAATAAVEAQEAAIKKAEIARDAVQAQYDAEQAKLDKVKQSYEEVADAIREVEAALRSMNSTAADINTAAAAAKGPKPSPAEQNFMDAEGGNFPEVGGNAQIGREALPGRPLLEDQSKAIDEFTKGIALDTAGMLGQFDMFGPIKDMWRKTWTWIKDNVGPYVIPIWTSVKELFTGGNPFGGAAVAGTWLSETFAPVGGFFSSMWSGIMVGVNAFWGGLKAIYGFFAEDFKAIWGAVLTAFKTAWTELGPAVSAFFPLIMPALEALWNVLKIIVAVIAVPLLAALKLISSVLAETLGPVLDFVIKSFANFIDMVRGVVQVLIGIFTGDFAMIKDGVVTIVKAMWDQVKNIFENVPKILWGIVEGLFKGIWDIIKAAGVLIWAAIKGIWGGVKDISQDFYDAMPGPIQAVLNVVIGIFKFFGGIIEGVFKALWAVVKFLWENVASPIFDLIVATFKAMGATFEFIYNTVLKPLFSAIGTLFEALGTAVKWVWEKVVEPVWNLWWGTVKRVWETVGLVLLIAIVGALKIMGEGFELIWTKVISPAWNAFTGGLKAGWKFGKEVLDGIGVALKVLGQAFEDVYALVIKPLWDRFTGYLGTAWRSLGKPVLDGIGTALTILGNSFTFLWDKVVQPAWKAFMSGLGSLWDQYGKGGINKIIGGINAVTSAINTLFKGLNAVGSKLGIGLKIDLIPQIPQLAVGGYVPQTTVGAGFKTKGARAIVGEGSSSHPEYVVPTDPRFRGRATQLHAQLTKDLGLNVPQYENGGILDKARDAAGSVGGAVKDAAGAVASGVAAVGSAIQKGAVMAALAPFLKGYDLAMDATDLRGPVREIANNRKNAFYNWAKGESDKYDKKAEAEARAAAAAAGSSGPALSPGNGAPAGSGWRGIDNWLNANAPGLDKVITSTVRPGDGGSYHQTGRAVDYQPHGGPAVHKNQGFGNSGLRAIFNALMPIAGSLKEVILAGAPFNIKNGRQVPGYAWGRPGEPGNHWNHVHAALAEGGVVPTRMPMLAEGGIVRRATTAVIGEAGPEAVMPLGPLMDALTSTASAVNQLNLDSALRAARWETMWLEGERTTAGQIIGGITLGNSGIVDAITAQTATLGEQLTTLHTEGLAKAQELYDARLIFDTDANTALIELLTANHAAVVENWATEASALVEAQTSLTDLLTDHDVNRREDTQTLVEAIASLAESIGGVLDELRTQVASAQETANQALEAANNAAAAAGAAAAAAQANADAIAQAQAAATSAPDVPATESATGSTAFGNGKAPGADALAAFVNPAAIALEKSIAAHPLPKQTPENDWLIQHMSSSQLTPRQLAYADMYGLTLKMAKGGIVNNATNAIIGERGPEAVVPLTQFFGRLDDGFRAIATVTAGVKESLDRGITVNRIENLPTGGGGAATGLVASAAGRVASVTQQAPVPANQSNGARTININGDLVLPNIKSGDDAEAFLRNLENLAG